MDTTQEEIYENSAKPLVDSVINGFNGTIFAYGQTSSGKTFTMSGVLNNPKLEGIIPRMIKQIFSFFESKPSFQFELKASMVEIYNEKVNDLIEVERTDLNIRETPNKEIFIENLSEVEIKTVEDFYNMLDTGNKNRKVAFTNMNANSSRSHSLVILKIKYEDTEKNEKKNGSLFLVDLAGSEKLSKTGAEGETLKEGNAINKSLTALGQVINALTQKKKVHVPYRNSKLTRILTESLGGNAKTLLIVTCSPSDYNEEETLSTLRFGKRAKKIQNKPKKNIIFTVDQLKEQIVKLEKKVNNLTKENEELRELLKVGNKEEEIKQSTPNRSNKKRSSVMLSTNDIKLKLGAIPLDTQQLIKENSQTEAAFILANKVNELQDYVDNLEEEIEAINIHNNALEEQEKETTKKNEILEENEAKNFDSLNNLKILIEKRKNEKNLSEDIIKEIDNILNKNYNNLENVENNNENKNDSFKSKNTSDSSSDSLNESYSLKDLYIKMLEYVKNLHKNNSNEDQLIKGTMIESYQIVDLIKQICSVEDSLITKENKNDYDINNISYDNNRPKTDYDSLLYIIEKKDKEIFNLKEEIKDYLKPMAEGKIKIEEILSKQNILYENLIQNQSSLSMVKFEYKMLKRKYEMMRNQN
ncbi:MAG: hypothetical protein MJ252_21370 [archaeon]|nr:hypothetical protein [archaeon]